MANSTPFHRPQLVIAEQGINNPARPPCLHTIAGLRKRGITAVLQVFDCNRVLTVHAHCQSHIRTRNVFAAASVGLDEPIQKEVKGKDYEYQVGITFPRIDIRREIWLGSIYFTRIGIAAPRCGRT